MAIIYPANRKEVADRVKTDIQSELPQSEPFLRNSYIGADATAMAGALYDAYKTIQTLQGELFPDTATGEFLERWASYKGIIRNSATPALGNITITGVAGTVVVSGQILQSSTGSQYQTASGATITSQINTITSLTRSGTTATAVTASAHHFADGNTVTISGANETQYNIAAEITVTGLNSFTYEVSGSPATPATGSPKATFTYASVAVQSLGYGEDKNLDSGSELTFISPLAGVDNSAFVQYDGITGGADIETDEELRTRMLYVYQNPISYFNVAALTNQARKVNGVTRVWVEETTPDTGQVTIYFMRDNSVPPIPSGADVSNVRDKILEIKPAHVNPADIFVLAPTPKPTQFQFSVLTPNTDTMREAIKTSLEVMFSEVPIVSTDLSEYAYKSAIYNAVADTTGEQVIDFVLATPGGTIHCAEGELATLDPNIIWP